MSRKWKFDLSQESTKRGLVLLIFGIGALYAALEHGEGSAAIISAGVTLAGAMGATRSD